MVDGKSIKVEFGKETLFTIDEVDCLFYFVFRTRFILWSEYIPHFEVGGISIF